ncbi:hypothetical protein AAHE18_01G262100 [Arachis hypogaea]
MLYHCGTIATIITRACLFLVPTPLSSSSSPSKFASSSSPSLDAIVLLFSSPCQSQCRCQDYQKLETTIQQPQQITIHKKLKTQQELKRKRTIRIRT